MATLSIEMHDYSVKAYGKVHAAGCRDMSDEMPFLTTTDVTWGTLLDEFNDTTGWDYEDVTDIELAPCARKALGN